jgi:hypothetical protein
MRAARVVGLSPDGRSLIVATDTGEELAIAADDRLRAALRGDRPRLGQSESEMESALSPREIQARVRGGEDLAEVARIAGIGLDRVERFAAPVLAERDHIARQAMASSVRRRGETSAFRNLRTAVSERLSSRGLDASVAEWDSHRMADGRWAVTVTYPGGEGERRAEFWYDAPGRFSVAGNDDARRLVGDVSSDSSTSATAGSPAGDRTGDDSEPTVDLSDELALVRVVQEAPDSSDGQAPDAAQSAGGPSDASAVPVTPLRVVDGGWEPAIVVDYPVEPGPPEDATDEPGPPDAPTSIEDRQDEAQGFEDEAAEHDVALHELPAEIKTGPSPEPEPPPKSRRKRASVPSWDEIMFGGPKPR